MGQSYVDQGYRTYTEHVAGALDGKEMYVVELASDGRVQLYTGAGASPALGVAFQKLKPGAVDVQIRLLGKSGTVKVVQNGAVACGARVAAVSGGKVGAANPGDRVIGLKLTPVTGADGDVIEILDEPEPYFGTPSAYAMTLGLGLIGSACVGGAYNSASMANVLNVIEELNADMHALVTAIKAHGIAIQ